MTRDKIYAEIEIHKLREEVRSLEGQMNSLKDYVRSLETGISWLEAKRAYHWGEVEKA